MIWGGIEVSQGAAYFPEDVRKPRVRAQPACVRARIKLVLSHPPTQGVIHRRWPTATAARFMHAVVGRGSDTDRDQCVDSSPGDADPGYSGVGRSTSSQRSHLCALLNSYMYTATTVDRSVPWEWDDSQTKQSVW